MGPVQMMCVKAAVRRELLAKGKSRSEINQYIDNIDEDAVSSAAESNDVSMAAMPVGKLGDGTIIQAILGFLKSPQGQQLIAALVQMLLHLMGG